MAEIRLNQPSFAGGIISPELHGRVDLAKYAVALREATNMIVHPAGGVSNRSGFEYIGDAASFTDGGTLHVPFEADGNSDSYILEFFAYGMRIIRDGGFVVYPAGHPQAGSVVVIVNEYPETALPFLRFTQSNDVMTFVHPDYPVRDLTRRDHHDWVWEDVSFGANVPSPAVIDVAVIKPSEGENFRARGYFYKVSAIVDGRESLPGPVGYAENDLSFSGNHNRITWSAVPGAEEYRIYKDGNGSGVFGFAALSVTQLYLDYNVIPDMSQGPQRPQNSLTLPGDRPAAVEYFQQRRIFAASYNQRQTFFGTRVAQYDSMARASPANDDDSFEFTVSARKRQTIKHIVALDQLFLFTGSAEWVVSGQNGGAVSGASPPLVKPQSYWGSSDVPPILIGDEILFIEAGGSRVRSFGYSLDRDRFSGEDLTILAPHLFKGRTITSWAYARDPDSVVWLTLDNGRVLSLTYMREQQVWAWAQHETDGFIEQVTAIREGRETSVYFIVQRISNGSMRRTNERMRRRDVSSSASGFFVDCGLTYSGPPTQRIAGLYHLEGRAVVGLADGLVFGLDRDYEAGSHVVKDGAIALDFPARLVHVGLPYASFVETLPLEANIQGETTQGMKRLPTTAVLKVKDTRGILVGSNSAQLFEIASRSYEGYGEPPEMMNGDIERTIGSNWGADASGRIEQRNPLPFTLLSIVSKVEFGE